MTHYNSKYCWSRHGNQVYHSCSEYCDTYCGRLGLDVFMGLCRDHYLEIVGWRSVRYYPDGRGNGCYDISVSKGRAVGMERRD